MDLESQAINDKVRKEIAQKYNISEASLKKILKLHKDFLVVKINEIDIAKDLSKQHNRLIIRGVGAIGVRKEFLIENDLNFGNITKKEYYWGTQWFQTSFKRFRNRIDKFNLKNKHDGKSNKD